MIPTAISEIMTKNGTRIASFKPEKMPQAAPRFSTYLNCQNPSITDTGPLNCRSRAMNFVIWSSVTVMKPIIARIAYLKFTSRSLSVGVRKNILRHYPQPDGNCQPGLAILLSQHKSGRIYSCIRQSEEYIKINIDITI